VNWQERRPDSGPYQVKRDHLGPDGPFPRATLEQAIKIPYAIKDKNGGNPWEPDEIRKAVGAGVHGFI
jgi:hypothetical protein